MGAGCFGIAAPWSQHYLECRNMKTIGQATRKPPAKKQPIPAWLDEFRQDAGLAAAPEHVNVMVARVQRFLSEADIRRPGQLTARTVSKYLGQIDGRSEKTLLNYRGFISRFCQFLKAAGVLSFNPCGDVHLRKPAQQLPRFLEPDEIETVLQTARSCGIWPEVMLALSTGLRRGEMVRLQWSDIDLDRQVLTVRISKSRRPRILPLSASAVEALQDQRRRVDHLPFVFPGRRTWRGGWRYEDKERYKSWWERALRPIQKAVPKFHSVPGSSTGRGWHLFRHTFASRAAQAGVSLYKIAAWLGHTDVRTTQIYAHLQQAYDKDIEAAAPRDRTAPIA